MRVDRLVEPDLLQVDVRDAAAHLVHLVLLEDRGVRRAAAVDLDVEDRVQAGRAGQRAPELALGDEIATGSPRAVEDAGDEALLAQAARLARAEALARLTISFVRSPAIPAAECSGTRSAGRIQVVFEDLLRSWDGEEAVIRYDGRAARGCSSASTRPRSAPPAAARGMRVYDAAGRRARRRDAALAGDDGEDGRAPTCRAAAARPCSRCRSCRPGDARRELLLRYGELVASLGGTYRTAGDMNISPADLDIVAERCPWVYGTTGAGGNSGRGTAHRRAARRSARASSTSSARPISPGAACSCRAPAPSAPISRGCSPRTGARRARRRDVDEARAAATGGDGRSAARGARDRVRRLLAVRGRRHAERRHDPAAALPRSSPARANNQLAEPEDARAPARARDPLRARLRRQRRRRHPARRARGRGLGRGRARAAASRRSATRCAALFADAERTASRPPPRPSSRRDAAQRAPQRPRDASTIDLSDRVTPGSSQRVASPRRRGHVRDADNGATAEAMAGCPAESGRDSHSQLELIDLPDDRRRQTRTRDACQAAQARRRRPSAGRSSARMPESSRRRSLRE